MYARQLTCCSGARSVVDFLQGKIGIPYGGFPEPFASRVLKDKEVRLLLASARRCRCTFDVLTRLSPLDARKHSVQKHILQLCIGNSSCAGHRRGWRADQAPACQMSTSRYASSILIRSCFALWPAVHFCILMLHALTDGNRRQLQGLEADLRDKYDESISYNDVMSAAMYPKVFDEYRYESLHCQPASVTPCAFGPRDRASLLCSATSGRAIITAPANVGVCLGLVRLFLPVSALTCSAFPLTAL